ncbi:hypothetical protein GCM10010365_41740 [Streptomyces poonensis]|uniref:DUF3152 domain-containing protein n=2 Tax=Streptomyces poonensis TaxID=68255 RepID=A0A918PPT4_9ACTN|nr:hypothetical protein GCM10010365_41740 [Streptomyces poonensis]GLJ90956.1 hypothetical protein GCM10017589_35620 [Streptomyces poonensis]
MGRPDASDRPADAGADGTSRTAQAKPASSPSAEAEGPEKEKDEKRKDGTEKDEKGEKDEKDEKDKKGKGKGKDVDPSSIPSSGPGTFTTAEGDDTRTGGTERLLSYRVQVEDGIGIPADEVADEVERVFADPRGWTADGKVGFRQASGGTSDFRVRLATAETVDRICGEYGLDTGGEVNCRVGQDVMVNLKRWLLATQYYADDVPEYRALIINHEVGHFLGHGHETCPGAGMPAPAMMQQIKGLKGCEPNAWPYDGNGRRITGPSVP